MLALRKTVRELPRIGLVFCAIAQGGIEGSAQIFWLSLLIGRLVELQGKQAIKSNEAKS